MVGMVSCFESSTPLLPHKILDLRVVVLIKIKKIYTNWIDLSIKKLKKSVLM